MPAVWLAMLGCSGGGDADSGSVAGSPSGGSSGGSDAATGGSHSSGGSAGATSSGTGGALSAGGPSGGFSTSGSAPGSAGGTSAGSVGAAGGSAAGNSGAGGAAGGAGGGAGSAAGGAGGATADGGTAGGGAPGVCPAGVTQTLSVAKDGSGQFKSVQAAVDSIPSGSSAHVRIDVKAGTYNEKLTIAGRTNLCLVGADAMSTILSYGDSNASVGSTSGSASVLVSANDFSAANLTFQNTHGSGSQAVALRTTGQREQFLNCRFVGYQDTLYTHQGTQYFRDCYVQGNTDYVFGGATAVLENCEVRNVEGGSAVAAPNTDSAVPYGIVFLGGKFTAASSVRANSVGLGRPWGASGAAAYLRVDLGPHIIAEGFVPMSGNQPQNARFHEYASSGSGASTTSRAAYQLSATEATRYTVPSVLAGWTPSYSQ